MNANVSETTKKLFDKLSEISDNDKDFVIGVLSNANHEDDQKKILEFIESGSEEVTEENLTLLSTELSRNRKRNL